MKKSLLLVGVLACTILLTGCGKDQKMVCNQKVSFVDVNMLVNYKGKKLEYLGLEYLMDLSSYNDEQIEAIGNQDMCSSVKDSMAQYGFDEAFRNCKQSVEAKTMKITADFDLEKLDKTGLSEEDTIEEAKNSLEKQGYTCTIN